jgi:hypothetical protein
MSPSKTPWKASVTVLLAASINPIGGAAQQCPDGLISAIEIERLNVFELQELEEGSMKFGDGENGVCRRPRVMAVQGSSQS